MGKERPVGNRHRSSAGPIVAPEGSPSGPAGRRLFRRQTALALNRRSWDSPDMVSRGKFTMQRRLAAIMVADIVAYSSLMEEAEEHTADQAARCREMIREQVASLGGRVFNTAGDAWLAEFASPINALRCAAEIRNTLAGAESIEAAPLRLRFGLHLADVVVQGDDLIGDGVNVASRIQQEADPDSICVSGVFFDHVRRNSPFAFDDLGERRLKNLSEPSASTGCGRS